MSFGTPPPSDPYSPQPAPGPGDGGARKGFFGALFDFSFDHFVTPMIVKVVYVLAVVALGIAWLAYIGIGFAADTSLGIVALVIGPVIILIYLAFIRMTLEFYLSVVRMSEDIHQRLR